MKITVIQADGIVGVDRVFREVDLNQLDPIIHAIQFDFSTNKGHVEYDILPDGKKPANEDLNSFSDYQWIVDLWEAAEPPAPTYIPPKQCTRKQGRLALLQTPHEGTNKLEALENLINSIPDPIQKKAAMIEYEADTWERDNLFLQSMWSQLGGTDQELTSLFELAVTL